MEQMVLKAIYKLKSYRMTGWMNVFQIDEIIQILSEAYKRNGHQLMDKLMEDLNQYYSNSFYRQETFECFVKEHMDEVADWLKRSKRTVYRKLQNQTFTLVEKRIVEEKMNDYYDNR